MSQTNSTTVASASSKSSLQSRLGTLVVIPWAGRYSEDGGDMPFLMAYSLGDGSDGPAAGEAAVLAVAKELGLPVGGPILDVSQVPKAGVTVLVAGGKAVLTMPYLHAACPVPDQWTAAAAGRGAVYVILAARPWPEAAPGAEIGEEALRDFAGDPEVLGGAAHFLVPVSSLRG
ncbi:DUF5949 family protein [Actinacidiphila sp. ITFR-21]|uniref:DUF5949 family protein n=1 Tax=Actinacidiphila sp. ITFR-21 TaxID=3075199 RepID=UPI0028898090|nr:DUF5949 family protein [Streptomyces sp. ITFR-21]WNI16493.1 DUF5949 family protein [Streptomyces sp. ITFR-21]